jgi:hypothetical protein
MLEAVCQKSNECVFVISVNWNKMNYDIVHVHPMVGEIVRGKERKKENSLYSEITERQRQRHRA